MLALLLAGTLAAAESFELPNGLAVVVLEDHSSPIVAVQVSRRVGSADDPAGRRGLAHLFEHLSSRGYTERVESMGGMVDAHTDEDLTCYHAVVASERLDELLALEARRFGTLPISTADLAAEREVVKEELRERFENTPLGPSMIAMRGALFAGHPYAWMAGGFAAELDAVKLDDARAFHAKWYGASNAVLSIAGDVEAEDVRGRVERLFGSLPKMPRPVRTRDAAPQPIEGPRRVEHAMNLATVAVGWRLPPLTPREEAALEVLSTLLFTERTGPLYDAVVGTGLAIASDGGVFYGERGGLFLAAAFVEPDADPAAIEAALRSTVMRVSARPIAADDLAVMKRRLRRDRTLELQTVFQKADALGWYRLFENDARLADRWPAEHALVTTEEVRALATRLLVEDASATVLATPRAR